MIRTVRVISYHIIRVQTLLLLALLTSILTFCLLITSLFRIEYEELEKTVANSWLILPTFLFLIRDHRALVLFCASRPFRSVPSVCVRACVRLCAAL